MSCLAALVFLLKKSTDRKPRKSGKIVVNRAKVVKKSSRGSAPHPAGATAPNPVYTSAGRRQPELTPPSIIYDSVDPVVPPCEIHISPSKQILGRISHVKDVLEGGDEGCSPGELGRAQTSALPHRTVPLPPRRAPLSPCVYTHTHTHFPLSPRTRPLRPTPPVGDYVL